VTADSPSAGDLLFEEGHGVNGGSPCSGSALAPVPPPSPLSHQGEEVGYSLFSHFSYGAEE
jgi:hypothetical protein